ncbi:Mu transposase C-terminal domain-containing protein [Rossellomorea vietnamensis]|uniref:Mu transposase C-terminal domain-containing protein n=1 Tax=Rossellomorea vietnamensis TaxID=218284 RepID=UPI001CCB04A3|nr:Mu transposase C-terminal domain-containing protein [Rossellomorea vietnamensis]MCA0151139.1 Mu transposase C-terminal domain-containing protein [Rossellomorea vietnamensis]
MLIENNIIEYLDVDLRPVGLERVLWISPENNEEVVLVDITDEKSKQFPYFKKFKQLEDDIRAGRARIIETDPDLRLISPEESYLNKYKVSRDINWNVIKDIVIREPEIYVSQLRGPMIEEVKEKNKKSKKEIYKLLKKYWFYGKSKNGLLRNYFNCGAPGKERTYKKKTGPKSSDGNSYFVTEKDKDIFRKAINKYHIDQNMNLTATHQHMCESYYNSGYYRKYGVLVPIIEPDKAPTLRQLRYWYDKEYSYSEKYKNRHGKRKADMEARAFQGNEKERILSVGYLFEIDSTPADIILVSEDRQTNIGTPTLYIVKDVFSRMITGFHASLAPPSTIEQMVAIENAASNKVEFCREYGIEIEEEDWPCENLPQFLNGDRGELKTKWAENLVNIKVDVSNAPSYRGDLKPYIEQHFRITNDKIRELLSKAGAKPGHAKKRGDKDPERSAALTIYEFTQFMILQIIAFNKSALNKEFFVTKEMFEDKVELTPIGVWSWGKEKKLLHQIPRPLLRYNLLPKSNASITKWGIEFSELCYTCETGIKEGWFERGTMNGKGSIVVSYDPRNVSSIFIRLKNGKLERCILTEKFKEYEGLHLEEVKAICKYKKEQLKINEIAEKQHQAELNAFSKELVRKAIKQTKDANNGISLYKRKQDKKATRKSESRSVGSENAWTKNSNLLPEGKNTKNSAVIEFPNKGFSKESNEHSNIHNVFKKNNERRRDRELE